MKKTQRRESFKRWLVKSVTSGLIFVSTVLMGGGLILYALTLGEGQGLDAFRSGNNANTLTADNWDELVHYVQVHDAVLGGLLLKLNETFSGIQSNGGITIGGGEVYYQGSKVDAVCGAANGGGFTSIPTFNLCLAGSLSGGIVAGTNVWTRTCKGVNSGEKADCFANQVLPDTPSVPTTPTTGYPGCNANDITLTRGSESYTIAACNVGATTAGIGAISYGDYYEWGKNSPFGTSGAIGDWSISSSARRGPCAEGYHVPSKEEWQGLVYVYLQNKGVSSYSRGSTYSWSSSQTLNTFMNDLKLPLAGSRNSSSSTVYNQGSRGYYRSSCPDSSNTAHFLHFYSFNVNPGSTDFNRYYGHSVRCFRDS